MKKDNAKEEAAEAKKPVDRKPGESASAYARRAVMESMDEEKKEKAEDKVEAKKK